MAASAERPQVRWAVRAALRPLDDVVSAEPIILRPAPHTAVSTTLLDLLTQLLPGRGRVVRVGLLESGRGSAQRPVLRRPARHSFTPYAKRPGPLGPRRNS